MTRVVSVGRSRGLLSIGALGAVLLTMSLAGCPGTLDPNQMFPPPASGTGGTTGAAGAAAGTTGGAGMAAAGTTGNVTLTEGCDITNLVTTYKCSMNGTCHDAAGSAANFDMATAGWQNNLVGVNPKGGGAVLPSSCAGHGPYIIKGSATGDGLFIQKISSATPPCGAQMPFALPAASAADIMCFRMWTTAVAANQ
jgi:hypothetical protein